MKYAMALATAGALLLSAPALAASSHGQSVASSTTASDNHGARFDGDNDRDDMIRIVDKQMDRAFHKNCLKDDRGGPDGDQDDRVGDGDHDRDDHTRGHTHERCEGHPESP